MGMHLIALFCISLQFTIVISQGRPIFQCCFWIYSAVAFSARALLTVQLIMFTGSALPASRSVNRLAMCLHWVKLSTWASIPIQQETGPSAHIVLANQIGILRSSHLPAFGP